MDLLGRAKTLAKKIKKLPSNIKKAIQIYEHSYRQGVEKFGIWWKIFTWSMWAFILVFFITAAIIFVYYLPLMQRIKLI